MHEIRKDPILGRWVIIASERNNRPTDFTVNREQPTGGICPFCTDSESHTPPEILAFRPGEPRPNAPGWQVRVVPNKYPALRIEGDLGRRAVGMYDMMNAIGAHEVVIESPLHHVQLADMAPEQVVRVLDAYLQRMLDLQQDRRFRYVLIFKNQGAEAGATLEHAHTQIIATPVVPKRVSEEIEGARRHFDLHERCVFCDIVSQESEAGTRVVEENASFVALEPFASRFPYETWILPRIHASRFETLTRDELERLSSILRLTLQRLDIALERVPFNYVLHTAPSNSADVSEFYHWHLEIMPKLTKVAGFEWGSDFFINPTPPEQAAILLRRVRLE
ncbi:MAG TPA: galactose-1-phosphate uridylyltransferase [Candidatus Krumholzibacteria bacterium]|nr:galactose-1-phosphate uridylyltransferase [Candidatus Krumholzibacteria bacterium]